MIYKTAQYISRQGKEATTQRIHRTIYFLLWYYFSGGSASWANTRDVYSDTINGLQLYEKEDYKASAINVWNVSNKDLFLEQLNAPLQVYDVIA